MKKLNIFFMSLLLLISFPKTSFADSHFEVRGAWISTVHNIDWPKTNNGNVSEQKRDFIKILDDLKKTGINTVYVQVRPKGDALYKSSINPWSDVLTGTQGKYPGYDPLAFMIEEAHKRDMKIEAWLNPYRVTTSGTNLNSLSENHPARKNPSWVISHTDGNGNSALYYNPELDEVKQHISDTVAEIVKNYNVDGIHFDDYFYPNRYPLPEFEGKDGIVAEERRDHVTNMVSKVSSTIKGINPKVQFGISPAGIWKNKSSDPTGSDTTGNESYYAHFADTRTWIKDELIDYVVPQIYWTIGQAGADYSKLVKWWSNEVKGTNVKLYIGQGIYKDTVSSEIDKQLAMNKEYDEIHGSIFFSTRDLLSNRSGCSDKVKNFYNNTNKPNANTTRYITTGAINLRETPSWSGKIVKVLDKNTKIDIIKISGDWAETMYNGKIVYTPSSYLKKDSSVIVPPTSSEPIESGVVINTTSLTVRSGPSSSYSSVTNISKGESVTILDTKNGWLNIKCTNGKTGWVNSQYIQII